MQCGEAISFRPQGFAIIISILSLSPVRISSSLLINVMLFLVHVQRNYWKRNVNTRLVWFLEYGGQFSPIQYGISTSRITVPLVQLEAIIGRAFTGNPYKVSVFFDLQKAYDTA